MQFLGLSQAMCQAMTLSTMMVKVISKGSESTRYGLEERDEAAVDLGGSVRDQLLP